LGVATGRNFNRKNSYQKKQPNKKDPRENQLDRKKKQRGRSKRKRYKGDSGGCLWGVERKGGNIAGTTKRATRFKLWQGARKEEPLDATKRKDSERSHPGRFSGH